MTPWLRLTCVTCAMATGMLTLVPGAAVAQNSLGAARDMYAAAAYNDALTVLNTLQKADGLENKSIVEQYRAFCLIALGRNDEANSALEAAVAAAPFSQLSESEFSPRIRSAFREVRRKTLPAIIERQYADARLA